MNYIYIYILRVYMYVHIQKIIFCFVYYNINDWLIYFDLKKPVIKLSVKSFYIRRYFRLAEVGKLETPKLQGKYETGQLILHRVFGYRGVILFPWLARVYDRDIPNKKEEYVIYNYIQLIVVELIYI